MSLALLCNLFVVELGLVALWMKKAYVGHSHDCNARIGQLKAGSVKNWLYN